MPRPLLAAALAAGLGAALLPAPAEAVTVPGDYPTIQEALADLMFGSLPSGTVIEVQPGTYYEALAYASSAKAFTLRGVGGAGATVVDASGHGKPGIKIRDTNAAILIEGLTITGASNFVGGGVVIERASPTLADSIVELNHTDNEGGGIFITGASNPVIRNCTIRNNTAEGSGGGIQVASGAQPLITGSVVENNVAGATSIVGTGGGIQVNDASPTITASIVRGNQAMFAGGGIFAIGLYGSPNGRATVTLEDSEVSENTVQSATASLAEGGGVHAEGNTLVRVTRTDVHGNVSESGGGLNGFRATYEVFESMIEDNQANGGQGGGIHVFGDTSYAASLTLTDSVVRNNTATNSGGVLVGGASCGTGGSCSTLEMTGSLIDGNTATYQGGGVNVFDAIVTIADSQLLRNQVTASVGGGIGGGLLIVNATATVTDTTVAENWAGYRGGGVHIENGSQVTIDRANVYGNSTVPGGGGGIFVGQNGPPTGTVSNSTIADNVGFQIREQACPPGLPAPILSYFNNNITNQGPAETYKAPCYPPAEVTSIAAFNNLSPGSKTVGNVDQVPDFTSFAGLPPHAPSVLAWSVPRASVVTIDNFGPAAGPTSTEDVAPLCTTTYSLEGVPALVEGLGPPPAPPPTCSGQNDVYNTQYSGTQVVEAGQLLTAELVSVLDGADVHFRAGEKIVLSAPFTVGDGASFQLALDACLCE